MRQRIGVIRAGEVSARAMTAHSLTALDRALPLPGELWVSVAQDEALILGAFQRAANLSRPPRAGQPVLRRGSGGPEVVIAPGTLHVALSLAYPGALAPCDEKHIVNRSVRPLLRALTKTGHLAHFFGRDWVSVAHRPAAWVGFGHDATSRRTLFEAFVAVRKPFAAADRASFLGKAPSTLESTGTRPVDTARLANAIVESFLEAYDADPVELPPPATSVPIVDALAEPDPPWSAIQEEAIGWVGAGANARGVFCVGGDLLVSRDALARLAARASAAAPDELGRIVDETIGAPGVALDGVRDLASLRDVIAQAKARR